MQSGKIESAKRFFSALKSQGLDVHFQTKINGQSLAQLMLQIDPNLAEHDA